MQLRKVMPSTINIAFHNVVRPSLREKLFQFKSSDQFTLSWLEGSGNPIVGELYTLMRYIFSNFYFYGGNNVLYLADYLLNIYIRSEWVYDAPKDITWWLSLNWIKYINELIQNIFSVRKFEAWIQKRLKTLNE